MRTRKVMGLLTAFGVAFGVLGLAQSAPLGIAGSPSGEHLPLPRLLNVLDAEIEWLTGLKIEAPGWDQALAALVEAQEEIGEALPEEMPAPQALMRLDLALHRVIDILERTAFRAHFGKEKPAGAPEWLKEYLDEATAEMTPEEAARVKAIVYGLFSGLLERAGEAVKAHVRDKRLPAGRAGEHLALREHVDRAREIAPEISAWIDGYLTGATAGMDPEQAREVRRIALGAVRAGWQYRVESQERQEDVVSHFRRLKGIAAGLDVFLYRGLERQEG